ncbi:hypothetical protein SAMN05444360_104146 [Chryseobacterium carnipullorum]|nr:hypothetical protein SAMN05444360_104146 [Chryseobacterium carnipullorum]
MNLMNITITQKQLIIANTLQFVLGLLFMRFSNIFRMNKNLHWIYSFGHSWYLMSALPFFFWGSLILGGYTIWKVKTNKILYLFFSLFPLLLFLIIIFFAT